MNTRTNLFLSTAIIAAPLAAMADHTAIHTIEQQIQALQRQLVELRQRAPAAIPANPFTATLRRGTRNAEVTRLQEFLAAMPEFYPEGLVTGLFGPATERAVKRFQQTYTIPAIGVVGPQTRAKLNELLVAKNTPLPAPAPEPVPAPAPAPTPPPPSTDSTGSPQASSGQAPPPPPAVSQVEPPTPVYVPTPEQLGQPTISAVVWGTDYVSVQFAHDPLVYTRSYTILRRKPGETTDTVFGPYAVPTIGTVANADSITFRRISVNAWEWQESINLLSQPSGDYVFAVKALGDGGATSFPSPGRITTLHPKAELEDLLQDAPIRAVLNNIVTRFPITMRIKNFYSDLYYHYELWDSQTRVWDSAYLNTAASSKIEAVFRNTNGYSFTAGKTYRLSVNAFDNNTGVPSTTKQPPGELVFTYQP